MHLRTLLRSVPCGLIGAVLLTGGCGGHSAGGATRAPRTDSLTHALRAFRRQQRRDDAWPSAAVPVAHVVASRLIATLADGRGGPWRLYLLETKSGVCLALPGEPASCHPGAGIFSSAPYSVIEVGSLIAAVVSDRVSTSSLHTPEGAAAVPISADGGILFLCPLSGRARSCAHDTLVGRSARGRTIFALTL